MSTLLPYLPQLMVAWGAYIIATASPGPAIVAIISTSISRGRAGGLALAAGVLTGSYTWAMLAAAGLSALIRSYGNALFVLKIAGGLYLLWLAFKALKAAMRKEIENDTPLDRQPPSLRRLYLKGLGIHLTNPKAIFSWLTLVSLGTPQDAPHVMPILIGGCMLLGIVIFMGFALLFSIEPIHRGYKRARRGIEAAMAGFFAFAGFKLLTARI
ncbi:MULTISPECIES: LysE family translocator [unclassified Rhizobium]|uniref:LysE family translocator n=1 Tax=unclassified Rhizobium TaxID=2613769 RepID=UPI0007133FB9|nr:MULTISPECIES: LysE family translocator [unclassified Rhizobium]KQS87656.1 amino acid transporter [Rhizobium sp. Leaf391]KQT07092.1 amino acid transporter [Rhizobium sp. Leaf386]KQT95218.1 amino acid transporter [Rhizobium sp. Leaf453]